ncbi:MAG: membrane protein insertase YidC [Pseudobdellovibrionaceae bacterium]
MKTQEPKLFDSKMIFAILLTGLTFIGWQSYLAKKYPEAYKKRTAVEETKKPTEATPAASSEIVAPSGQSDSKQIAAGKTTTELAVQEPTKPAQIYKFESDKASFEVSSAGFAVQNYSIKTYKDSAGLPIQLLGIHQYKLFEVLYLDQKLNFDIKQTSPGLFEGSAQVGNTEIRRVLKFDPEKFVFASTLRVIGPSDQFYQTGIQIVVPDKINIHENTSWLFPSFQHQDFIVIEGGTKKRSIINVDKASENILQSFAVGHLTSISSQYFSLAVLDESEVMPSVQLSAQISDKNAFAKITYKPASPKEEFIFNQKLYAGPKSHDLLESIHVDMKELINFGFFGVIGEPLLLLMKWFFSLIGNWGFAIIMLTIFVRFLVLPLYLMSVKSMKAMQKIQPMMKAIQEKHKADPMTMNREVMALMKEHKANPLGGCLPMLLQIPIFFALYQVIASSIELYQSPFIFWIHDLSQSDPFYVLPVLMGVMMWFQQKITPTTMDPAQAKILAFMPIIFSVFMLALPSGLTLYMCISSLFGIGQQLLLVPQNKTT